MAGRKQWHLCRTPQGEKPLVAAAFDAISAVCEEMIVVLGHEAEEVAKLLAGKDFHTVLSDPDAPMFESIRAGLDLALQLSGRTHVLLHPGDHPEVAESTLFALLSTAAAQGAQAVLPEFQGRGGHPVLIPPPILRELVEAECPDGLGQFWDEHPEHCARLPVNDASVLRDIDTF